MSNKQVLLIYLSLLLPCAAYSAVSDPTIVLEKALEQGITSEEEINGPLAQMMQAQTHSKSNPKVKAEKLAPLGKCSVVRLTTTMPNIPNKEGSIVGDYVVVSKLTLCPDGKLPEGIKGQEIVSCNIGSKSCKDFGF